MVPTYRVVTSPRAAAELDEIRAYISQDSPAAATTVMARLREAMHSLEAMPHRYPINRGKRRPATAIRRLPVLPYLIYYHIDDQAHVVSVVTVATGEEAAPTVRLRPISCSRLSSPTAGPPPRTSGPTDVKRPAGAARTNFGPAARTPRSELWSRRRSCWRTIRGSTPGPGRTCGWTGQFSRTRSWQQVAGESGWSPACGNTPASAAPPSADARTFTPATAGDNVENCTATTHRQRE